MKKLKINPSPLRRSVATVALLPLLVTACGQDSGSDGESDKLNTDKLEMIVQVSPGGGWDTMSRAVADFLPACVDGSKAVTVYNRIGQGEQFRVITSDKTGTKLGPLPFPGVIGGIAAGEDRDLDKVQVLGSVGEDPYVTAVSKKSGITSLEDLATKDKVLVGNSSGKTGGDFFVNVILSGALGGKWTYVNHEGSQEAGLAAIRGDVDLVTQPLSSIAELLKDDSLVPIVVYSAEPVEELPDVVAAGQNPLTKEIADLGRIYRVLMISSAAPDGAAETLQAGIKCVAENRDFIKRMGATGSPVTYMSPEETLDLQNRLLKVTEENQDRFDAVK